LERFVFNVTNRCNFKCKMCFRGKSTAADLTCEDVEKVVGLLKRMGVKTIALTGGEPILSPRFEEVLKLTVKHGFGVGIVTNGWFYDDYVSLLERYRKDVHYIALSLDGHTAEVHDAVRRKGSFDRAVRAMEVFRDRGYKLHIGHILNRHNYPYLTDFCKFVAPHKPVLCLGRVIKTEANGSVQLTGEQESTLHAKIVMLFRMYKGMIFPTSSIGMSRELLFCTNFLTMEDITLRFDGKVVFCCDSPIEGPGPVLGDVRRERIDEIIPRFGRKLGEILSGRIEALAEGKRATNNNCDFCSRVLSGLGEAQ